MTDLKEKTVAQIVTEDIATAAIFKRNGIDFCCGGKVGLNDICTKKNLDTNTIVEELTKVMERSDRSTESDPDSMTLSQLIDNINASHHAYVRENLPVLIQFADKVAKVHGHGAPEVVEVSQLVHSLEEELLPHLMKEEMVLFPFVKEMEYAKERGTTPIAPFGTVNNPINMMQIEHEDAGETLARLRVITSDYQPPEWACNTYRALYHMLGEFESDLHLHIHKENNILFPKAIELEASLN